MTMEQETLGIEDLKEAGREFRAQYPKDLVGDELDAVLGIFVLTVSLCESAHELIAASYRAQDPEWMLAALQWLLLWNQVVFDEAPNETTHG